MNKAAVDFMTSQSAYRKVLRMAHTKYHSYGKVTGTMSLKTLSPQEVQDIASFLAVPLYKLQAAGKFKLEDWVRSYEDSRFSEVPFESLVETIIGESLTHHSDIKVQLAFQEQEFLKSIRTDYQGFAFLSDDLILNILYRRSVDHTLSGDDLKVLSDTFLNLPTEPIYLPSFAQKRAHNPHAFDFKAPLGSLFHQLLELYSDRGEDPGESAAERRYNLFLSHNIILDNIQNYVSVHGFVADDHPMWQGAVTSQVSMNVPIKHIASLKQIRPYDKQVVYIFENSSLFSAVIDELPHISAVCTHGQFRNAAWEFFKRIPDDVILMYSGDFDPEGLLMCQTFCHRFPNALPWGMGTTQYLQSSPHETITERRLKMLDSITHASLLPLAEAIQAQQKAGYQEALFNFYISDILSL